MIPKTISESIASTSLSLFLAYSSPFRASHAFETETIYFFLFESLILIHDVRKITNFFFRNVAITLYQGLAETITTLGPSGVGGCKKFRGFNSIRALLTSLPQITMELVI